MFSAFFRLKIILIVVACSLTACLENTHVEGEEVPIATSPEVRAKGESLYANHCASCHNGIESSNKPNMNMSRLENGLRTVLVMSQLRNILSQEDREALVVALTPDDGGSEEPPEDTGPAFDFNLYNLGAQIYVSKTCYLCHGSDIKKSAKRDISVGRLEAAIGPSSPYAAMRSITLTESEKEALIYALSNTPPDIGGDTGSVSSSIGYKVPVPTRQFIGSKMKAVFLVNGVANSTDDDDLEDFINTDIIDNVNRLGGDCSGFDSNNYCLDRVITSSSMQPNTSSVRSASLNYSCQKVISIPTAISNVLINSGLDETDVVDAITLSYLWDTMIPQRAPDTLLFNQMMSFAGSASQLGLTNESIWRLIALGLCESPQYEVF